MLMINTTRGDATRRDAQRRGEERVLARSAAVTMSTSTASRRRDDVIPSSLRHGKKRDRERERERERENILARASREYGRVRASKEAKVGGS